MNEDFSSAFQWPLQDSEILRSLQEVYQSGDWGRYDGRWNKRLTEALSVFFGIQFARTCSSGTVAVEIALAAAGVGANDEVILAAYDFPGNFRSIEAISAIPVLADLKPGSWSISAESFSNAISDSTRAVIVSHLHGSIADIRSICTVARERNIAVIEDICQCPGARIHGQRLGTFGDVAALSFGGSKLLSAGRGGAILTDDPAFHQRARIYSERGNNAHPLSELQAAVLIPQLNQLDSLNRQRDQGVQKMEKLLAPLAGCSLGARDPDAEPAFFKVPILLQDTSRKQPIVNWLRSQQILIDHGFRGFAGRSSRRCRSPVDLPVAIDAARGTMVLHHPCLISAQLDKILATLVDSLQTH